MGDKLPASAPDSDTSKASSSATSLSKTRERAAFLVGVSTTVVVVLILFARVADRVGYSLVTSHLYESFAPGTWRRRKIIQIPPEVVDELAAAGGVIDNTYNPTNATRHDTLLVQPDRELGFVLRPDVQVSAHLLKANDSLNLDPPVLYVRVGTQLTAATSRFIAANQRSHFICTTDREGFRKTVPTVDASRRLLMVGDSVCFGLGVDDHSTIPSFLQERIGLQTRVYNAGVGGYDGFQACKMAARLSRSDAYELLIYVACENDFEHSADNVQDVLEPFNAIRARFEGRIVVAFVPYVEYAMNEILGHYGFVPGMIRKIDELRVALPKVCGALGLQYVDFTNVIEAHKKRKRTIFAGFDLYVDHCHLSPDGNKLAAGMLCDAIKQ